VKARIERDALVKALKVVLPGAGVGTALPVLSGVWVDVAGDTMTLTTTNLDLTVAATVAVDGQSDGSAIVGANVLSRVATAMPSGAVEVTSDGSMTVECGDTYADLWCISLDQWPAVPTCQGDEYTLSAQEAKDLRRVIKMASVDPDRPVYRSINFAGGKATVADSYRLAQVDIDAGVTALILAVNLAAVIGHTDDPPVVTVGEHHVSFRAAGVTWTTGVTEGAFPTQAQIEGELRPSSPYAITVDADRLDEAVKRVCAIGTNGHGGDVVTLTTDGVGLTVSRRQADVGGIVDVLSCESTYDQPISFNPRFLRELLAASEADDVTFEIVDSVKSVVVRTDRLAQALMPVNSTGQR
jgi:DNA polymerase III subunit beta